MNSNLPPDRQNIEDEDTQAEELQYFIENEMDVEPLEVSDLDIRISHL